MAEKDCREEEKKKVIVYPSLAEALRATDHNRKKQKKKKLPVRGWVSEMENQERLEKEAIERERKDIQTIVQQSTFNKTILDDDIYIIDVNSVCRSNDGYVIGEVTVLRFNIRNGITDSVHEIINPSDTPYGYVSDIKRGCQEFALDFFLYSEAPKTNFLMLLAIIMDYLKQKDTSSEVLPPLYTMPEKVAEVKDFMKQLCCKAHEDVQIFRVYKLDIMFFNLINSLKKHNYEGLPKESLALATLKKDAFWGTVGLCCEHHQLIDRTTVCTRSRAKCWALTILNSCCPVAGVGPLSGLPGPKDLEDEASSSSVSRDTSCNNSSASVPPKASCSNTNSKMIPIPAPDLTENNFPTLKLGSGRGSGRNISSGMKNLYLDK